VTRQGTNLAGFCIVGNRPIKERLLFGYKKQEDTEALNNPLGEVNKKVMPGWYPILWNTVPVGVASHLPTIGQNPHNQNQIAAKQCCGVMLESHPTTSDTESNEANATPKGTDSMRHDGAEHTGSNSKESRSWFVVATELRTSR
jgi:hypothetical protein